MGSTCSMNRSKQQKKQSVDQLSFECDEYGVLHPEEPEIPPKPRPTTTKPPPKSFDPDENDASDTWGWVSCKQFHNYFYEGFYAPFILNPDYMIIIDARSEEAFHDAHIVTSQWHGDVPLQDNKLDFRRFSLVILCDQDGAADENSIVRRIQHHMIRKWSQLEPMIVRGGVETIEKQFPYMMMTRKSICGDEKPAFIPWFPAIVLDNCLYMGRTEHALNVKVIKTLSITHVVNLSAKTPGIFPFVSYLCIPIDESENAELRTYFSQINAQISKALTSGGRVLVHCDEGVDPSATIVIAFLMMEKGCSLADAHDYVKSLRPIIQPNDSSLLQLSEYEVDLFGRKFTNIEDLWI